MSDEQPARHVATERDAGRGTAETAQPDTFLSREALLDAMVEVAGEPAFLDRLADGLTERMGAFPTADEIASAITDIRDGRTVPVDSGHGQVLDVDDEQGSSERPNG